MTAPDAIALLREPPGVGLAGSVDDDVNLAAPLACNRAALPLLEAAAGGSVVSGDRFDGRVARHRPWRSRLLSRTAEVVPAVLFLAGDGSAYVSGTTLYVDAGWTAT